MGPTILWILKYLLPLVFTYCIFFLIYKIIPNKMVHFKSALKAALFASILWELAKHLFAWYVANIATYSIFYGSLSALVVFVLWVYYSSRHNTIFKGFFISLIASQAFCSLVSAGLHVNLNILQYCYLLTDSLAS